MGTICEDVLNSQTSNDRANDYLCDEKPSKSESKPNDQE